MFRTVEREKIAYETRLALLPMHTPRFAGLGEFSLLGEGHVLRKSLAGRRGGRLRGVQASYYLNRSLQHIGETLL